MPTRRSLTSLGKHGLPRLQRHSGLKIEKPVTLEVAGFFRIPISGRGSVAVAYIESAKDVESESHGESRASRTQAVPHSVLQFKLTHYPIRSVYVS